LKVGVIAIDHVQLAMPVGGETKARAFYAGTLGLAEVAKPGALTGRGGAWFSSGTVHFHLGVEEPFQPARKAHPGRLVGNRSGLSAAAAGRTLGAIRSAAQPLPVRLA